MGRDAEPVLTGDFQVIDSLGLDVAPSRRLMVSPLRYPGGKGSLYPVLKSLVRANGLTGGTYVEPYAGGAGAAVALLVTGEVGRIVINDLDPALYAFWRSVVKEPDDFASRTRNAKLTIAEWKKQKRVYSEADRKDYLRLGFATFYLNRTNHSGVLNGGPIGGLDQSGAYKIDARFNKTALLERLRLIGMHSSSIVVLRQDGRSVIEKYAERPEVLLYADPPYFEKAGSLYMNSFQEKDHRQLADCLNASKRGRWLLTYDDVPDVSSLYAARRREEFSLAYSAHRVVKATEMMVFGDGLLVPWLADKSKSARSARVVHKVTTRPKRQ
ncbi:MAG: DNA adenine methylase [Actinomycetia bacterium]|nr:DNA adenine methylase [Actinomycetes bacterium]